MSIDTETVRNGQLDDSSMELMGGFLTREAILASQDMTREPVDVPEWGGRVLVTSLTGKDRDRFEASIFQTNGKNRELNMANIRAKLVALSVIDPSGKRVFSDQDVAILSGKSAAALSKVYDVAARLSGISPTDAEELAKNSRDALNVDSTSD